MGYQILVDIDDKKVNSFSASAKETLKSHVTKYSEDLVREANLLEEGSRESGAGAEITSNIVLQAVRRKTTMPHRRASIWLILCKIISPLSCMATGFLFDRDLTKYQSNPKLFWALLISFGIACVTTAFQTLLDVRE